MAIKICEKGCDFKIVMCTDKTTLYCQECGGKMEWVKTMNGRPFKQTIIEE